MRGSTLLALCIVAASLTGSSAKGSHNQNAHQLKSAVLKAEAHFPSISSIGDEIGLLQLESPSFRSVETKINKEYRQYSKVIDQMEYDRSHSSERSCEEQLSKLNKAHRSLSRDLSVLHSAEVSNPTLALMQSSLQEAMSSDSQLMYALSFYIVSSMPSFAAYSEVVEDANIDSPSAFTDVVDVLQAIGSDSAVSSALCALSAQVHSLPSTIVSELVELISDSSQVVGTKLASLESCYSTVFSEVTSLESFVKSHPTIETSVTAILEIAEDVSGFTSAVTHVATDIAPSLISNVKSMTKIDKSWATASSALEFEQQLLDSSPTLNQAAETVQSFFNTNPTVALSLFYDICSPSIVTNPTQVENEERSHPSFVSAVDYERSWEDSHSRDAGFLDDLSSVVISALLQDSNLVSVLSSMSYYDHPATYSASVQVGLARSLVPTVTTLMSSIDQLIDSSASVGCAETVIASYAASQPTLVIDIWQGLTDTKDITDVSSFASVTAKYSALMSAFDTVLEAEKSDSSLIYYQTQLIYIEQSDSSFISQWSVYTEASYSLSEVLSNNGDYESSSSRFVSNSAADDFSSMSMSMSYSFAPSSSNSFASDFSLSSSDDSFSASDDSMSSFSVSNYGMSSSISASDLASDSYASGYAMSNSDSYASGYAMSNSDSYVSGYAMSNSDSYASGYAMSDSDSYASGYAMSDSSLASASDSVSDSYASGSTISDSMSGSASASGSVSGSAMYASGSASASGSAGSSS